DDPTKPAGIGLLGKYRGAEPPPGTPYSPDAWLPSQIDALATTLNGRQIDALVISGGGNDIGFGNVAKTCILNARCYDTLVPFDFDPTLTAQRKLSDVVQRQASLLPQRYDNLAAAINNSNPSGRPAIHAAHVFLSEYPDPT